MLKKPFIYFILFFIGFFFLLAIPYGTCSVVSGGKTLGYNEEEAVLIYPKLRVDWSFSGSNPNVNITLHSYSESCYISHGWSTIVSEDHVSDSGSWSVQGQPVCDTSEENNVPPFYFVFSNEDPDQEDTTVTYTLTVDPALIPGYNVIIIISILAIVSAIVSIVALKKKYKTI
ncbi:MAG: hypothetical protein ACFFBH_03000 [Promethearchaeota archaeon]